jgi:hypothetical protein
VCSSDLYFKDTLHICDGMFMALNQLKEIPKWKNV